MQIERVDITPRQDVYNPGDVINITIYFRSPFVGQCLVALVPSDHTATENFPGKTFSKSGSLLYEGQIYVRESDIGTRKLLARLIPVKGEPQSVSVGGQIFEVRPLVPAKR